MKKIFFLTIIFFSCTKLYSQNFYFPSSLFSDSVAFEKNLPSLAAQMVAYHNANPDIQASYQTLTDIKTLAKDYKGALLSLDDLLATFGKDTTTISEINFLYRPYIIALEKTATGGGKSYLEVYASETDALFPSLTEEAVATLGVSILSGVNETESDFSRQIENIGKSYTGDSISYKNAVTLCDVYNFRTIFTGLGKTGGKLFASHNQKFRIEDSVLIRMPDGGLLAATIVRKKEITEPQPVVLMYNIYPGYDVQYAMEAANKGYVGVVVNTRGKRLSPDTLLPFEKDAEDAWYMMDWISKQPWSNGKIGMYGGSYLGFSQWSATKNLHPALKTIIPMVAVGPGIDYPNHNGIFMSYMLRWIHYVTNNKMTDQTEFSDIARWNQLFEKWYRSGGSFRSLDSLDGRFSPVFQRWLEHPSYDSYWQNMTPQKEEFAKINIPILTITGYYDDDQLGAFHYYKEHLKWNPNARDNDYLLIGPYDHFGSQGYPRRTLSNYTIDSVANIPITDIAFKWFDHVLKDSVRPEFLKDKVNFEVMGKNEWRHVPSLEKMNNDTLTFYLAKGNEPGHFMLETKKPAKQNFISQTVDFTDRSFMRFEDDVLAGVDRIIDTVVRNSKDEMIFVSAPVEKPFEINGPVTADIFASVNKKDMDLVMYVFVQEPDGKYFYLNRNLQRASFLKDRTQRQLLKPGKIENIRMENNFFSSKLVQPGSRIVIALGINKSPAWQVNYGTGKDVSDETIADAKEPLRIKWYNSSTIKIPVWKD